MRHLARFALPDAPAGRNAWEALRRPPRHSDEALTGTARAWLRRLPPGRRPLLLCMQFPRLANLIAWHWRDPAAVQAVLDDLVNDRRGGRTGFAPAVMQELRRLRDFQSQSAVAGQAQDDPGWLRRLWPRH